MPASVLIVDDNEDSREILAMILGMHGYRTLQARDGMEAIEMAREHMPSVIVTDIFMPRLDGIDLTRHLRDDPTLAAIPVIAQTAYMTAVDTHRDLFAAVLEKPCQPSELLATLDALGIGAKRDE
jgi:two-component system cell cycle response regulator DivK